MKKTPSFLIQIMRAGKRRRKSRERGESKRERERVFVTWHILLPVLIIEERPIWG